MVSFSIFHVKNIKWLNLFFHQIKLERFLAPTQESILVVDGENGNCFYRAISKAISGTEDNHVVVRSVLDFLVFLTKGKHPTPGPESHYGGTDQILVCAFLFCLL